MVNKMAQWIKGIAAKLNLSLIPGTYMVEEETCLPHTYHDTCMCAHIHTHVIIKHYKIYICIYIHTHTLILLLSKEKFGKM